MNKLKIIKGDNVMVTTGKDSGKQAVVEKVWVDEAKVLLPGLNQYKKHKKPTQGNQKGEIVTLSRPLPIANIALICPKCKQRTRVGYLLKDGKKTRVCRKCDQTI